MIALSHGELRWHSTPGQGTLFQFTLPLAAPPPPALEPRDPSTGPRVVASEGRPRIQRFTRLVASTDVDSRAARTRPAGWPHLRSRTTRASAPARPAR